MDDVIIFGAGKWGRIAYPYYENVCRILCYVDNDAQKWGTILHGREIKSPDVLRGFQGKVIIAVQNELGRIEAELKRKYGVCRFMEFRVEQRNVFLGGEREFGGCCVVMEYMGGLGNQLFQYAMGKYLEWKGCQVAADITHYSGWGTRSFELDRLFRDDRFQYASGDISEYYRMKDKVAGMEKSNRRYVYEEPDIAFCAQYGVSEEWGKVRQGIVRGYFQTYFFADQIRGTLLKCLEFPKDGDKTLYILEKEMKGQNCVSIHVRRGDYLAESGRRMDGICDFGYYERAMRTIRERVEDPRFCFFSDDIAWCRENIRVEDAIYVDSGMFRDYEDWYDMYLMSKCKHNIIANSSFSWWGAWLNENDDKIVIAPGKWDNFCHLTNICPPAWVRM